MSVPASYVDKSKVEPLFHKTSNSTRREFKALRTYRIPISFLHFYDNGWIPLIAHRKALRHLGRQFGALVHRSNQTGLPDVDSRLGDRVDSDIRHLLAAAEC